MPRKSSKLRSETHIPEEIILQILAKLPPKSILRFKSVSKGWCALIDNPSFINYHLDFINADRISHRKHLLNFWTTKTNMPSILDTTFLMNPDAIVQSLNDPPSIDAESQLGLHGCMISKSDSFSKTHDTNQFTSTILGPVNGVYCVLIKVNYFNRCTLLLWSPGIRQFHVLPRLPPPALPPKIAAFFYNRRKNQSFIYGFGYDPSTDDYKIILMTELGNDFYERYIHYSFHLYSLSTDEWKQLDPFEIDPHHSIIEAGPDGDITFVHEIKCSFYGDKKKKKKAVYSNGACHWYLSGNKSIFTFDFGDETLKVTPIPQEITENKKWVPTLATSNGCLALICSLDCTNLKTLGGQSLS